MAWTLAEEQALTIAHDHLWCSSIPEKFAFYDSVMTSLFPRRGWVWEQEDWCTYKGITAASAFGDEHLERNLKLAIIGEMLGIGPNQYCIIDSDIPDFEDRLRLILEHLPARKICLYPPRAALGGPFSLPPWDTIGRSICGRPSLEDNLNVTFTHLRQEQEMESEAQGHLIDNRILAPYMD